MLAMKKGLFLSFTLLPLTGCSFLQQASNDFHSTSVLGYVRGPANSSMVDYNLKADNPLLPIQNGKNPQIEEKDQINVGDCIVVRLGDGILDQPFETAIEKKIVKRTRNEISLNTTIYEAVESDDKSSDKNNNPPGRAINLFTAEGIIAGRPFPWKGTAIYGPQTYNGGDLVFVVNMYEVDEDEIASVANLVKEHTDKISNHLPDDAKKEGLHSLAAKALSGTTLKLTSKSSTIAAVGLETVELFTEAYEKIHKQNDAIISKSFTLAPTSFTGANSTLLQLGHFPLIRLSTKGAYPSDLIGAEFDPIKPKLLLKSSNNDYEPTWISFAISKSSECPTKGKTKKE